MELKEMTASVEAVLFACGEPVGVDRLCETLEVDRSTVAKIVRSLNNTYEEISSALKIVSLGDKFQMTTDTKYADVVRKALEIRRNQPLSQAAFETLAVIAYNQPVTKAFVEQVRGVDCSGVISGLCEKGLIEECGRLDLPGRPLLYATSDSFLRCFGISDLSQLPAVPDNGEEDAAEGVASENKENEIADHHENDLN